MTDNLATFTLNLFLTIGVDFHHDNSWTLKRLLKKIIEIYFHLYAVYFFAICLYGFYCDGLQDGQNLSGFLYFFTATLLRVLFIRNFKEISEVAKLVINSTSFYNYNSKKYIKICILSCFALNMILSFLVSFKELFSISTISEALEYYRHLLFNTQVSSGYYLILTPILEFTRNYLELEIPALTIMILSVLYRKLIALTESIKSEVDNVTRNGNNKVVQLLECSQLLHEACKFVHRVDKVMSRPLFCLVFLQIMYIMNVISVFAEIKKLAIEKSVVLFLVAMNAVLSLIFLLNLASKIPEIFTDIKTAIMVSDIARKEILSGHTTGVLGLGSILNEMTSYFQITVLGAIKIDKSTIITILCGLITYGVILFQMFEKSLPETRPI